MSGEYITPGRSKWFWVITLTTPTAPGATQINAGVDLTAKLQGMPAIPRTGNVADSSDLSSTFEKRQRGTVGGDMASFTLKRDRLATETAYAAMVEGVEGYLVGFRKGTAGATPAIGDKADVFACTVNAVGDGSPGRNDVDFATIELVITDNPNRDVTVTT